VTDLLIAARARVKAGWCKGRWTRRRLTIHGWQQQYCMLGALGTVAVSGTAAELSLYAPAHRHLHSAMRQLGYRYRTIPEFNDARHRSKGHVLEVCDLAIELSKECIQ